MSLTHPFAVKRARELMAWVGDGSYDRVRGGLMSAVATSRPLAELAAAITHYGTAF